MSTSFLIVTVRQSWQKPFLTHNAGEALLDDILNRLFSLLDPFKLLAQVAAKLFSCTLRAFLMRFQTHEWPLCFSLATFLCDTAYRVYGFSQKKRVSVIFFLAACWLPSKTFNARPHQFDRDRKSSSHTDLCEMA